MKKRIEASAVPKNAAQIYDKRAVSSAIKRMAEQINAQLAEADPLVLTVMTGGIVPTGMLLPQLCFPLRLDYIHASRYQGKKEGGAVQWFKKPGRSLRGETVLLIDDILDRGVTLRYIMDYCKKNGAKKIYTAVLTQKHGPRINTVKQADFVGLSVPDQYVFGCGMDYYEYHRNHNGIYAVKEVCRD